MLPGTLKRICKWLKIFLLSMDVNGLNPNSCRGPLSWDLPYSHRTNSGCTKQLCARADGKLLPGIIFTLAPQSPKKLIRLRKPKWFQGWHLNQRVLFPFRTCRLWQTRLELCETPGVSLYVCSSINVCTWTKQESNSKNLGLSWFDAYVWCLHTSGPIFLDSHPLHRS